MRGLMFSVLCVAAIVGNASLGHGQVHDDAVFRKALDLYEAKDFETAWSLFEVAASEDASNPRPHYYLGDLAVKLGKPLPVALAHFRRALDLSGGDPTFRAEAMAEVKKLERLIRNEEEATRARNKAAREKEEALDRARRELNAEAARFLASLRGKWIRFGGEFSRDDNMRERLYFWEACAKLSSFKLKDGVVSDIAFEVWQGMQWIVTELPERTKERYYGYSRSRYSSARPGRLSRMDDRVIADVRVEVAKGPGAIRHIAVSAKRVEAFAGTDSNDNKPDYLPGTVAGSCTLESTDNAAKNRYSKRR